MSFNLKSLKTHPTGIIKIKTPEGEPTGVEFMVYGPTSEVAKQQQIADAREVNRMVVESGKMKFPDPKQKMDEKPAKIAARVYGWSGYVDEKKEPVPYTQQACEEMLSDPESYWVFVQIEEGVDKLENFTKRVSAS